MPLKPATRALTFLLGVLMAVMPLAMDILMPIMPALALAFSAEVSVVQMTVTMSIVGMACGQLIYGPLSDRYGRRPLLIAGLSLATIAAIFCAHARSIEALIAWRFLEALGASCGPVLARAMVRDMYAREAAARTLALMMIVLSLAPLFAPLIGGWLVVWRGWEATFWLAGGFIAAVLLAVIPGLPETAPRHKPGLPRQSLLRTFSFLLRQREFIAYMAPACFSGTVVMLFLSGSAFVLVGALGYSAIEYSYLLALVMVGQIAGATVASRLVGRLGVDRTLRAGAVIAVTSGLTMACLGWLNIDSGVAIVGPMIGYMVAHSFLMPTTTAGALTPFPSIAGAASALLGFCQLGCGAVASLALGWLYDGTQRPMTLFIGAASMGVFLSYAILVRGAARRRLAVTVAVAAHG
ncbi:MAG: Bcr/CflA family efflux MFS transporter [Betaproteobacteria bacterium]|nr:Bcr/CflA family efflux MFS transporter [Betaproteobacteria bacterium]